MRAGSDVLVIGAGVSGLSTAVCLAEEGFTVRVRTRHRPEETTSCAAGAIWGPYLVDDNRVLRWSALSRSILADLATTGGTGVRLGYGLEASRTKVEPPVWASTLEGFRVSRPEELPAGFATGWWYPAPLVDMPVYLSYLAKRLAIAGGRIETGTVSALEVTAVEAVVTINCAGIGARELVPDHHVTPSRGQVVVVENPGIDRFFAEHDESPAPTYFLPHGDRLVLGGSAEPGRVDVEPDRAVSAAIIARCAAIEPSVGRARVLAHRVGLRPSRGRVRVERTTVGGRWVIHNYGHGGAGVTLSWGCAREVLALASEVLTGE